MNRRDAPRTWPIAILAAASVLGIVVFSSPIRSDAYDSAQSRLVPPTTAQPDTIAARAQGFADDLQGRLANDGWLYISYRDDIFGEVGLNPETGKPLPDKIQWELWYLIDKTWHPTAALVRHTDLATGDITLVAWSGDRLIRAPGAQVEDGQDWSNHRPVLDDDCNSRIRGEAQGDFPARLTHTTRTDASGTEHWTVTISSSGEPVVTSDITGKSATFVGSTLACTWNQATSALEESELRFLTDAGEAFVYQRSYDYAFEVVPTPPSELLNLLAKLASTN